MLPVLLYQRTHYAWPLHRRFRRVLAPLKLYGLYWRLIAPLIERARQSAITAQYSEELAREFAEIEPHLPAAPCKVLDIGCGLAGIDLWLYRHYRGAVSLNLLDKEGVSDIFYGFEQQAAHYSKAALTKRFLLDNGVEERSVAFYDAHKNEFPTGRDFNLVISLISWGFHYPLETYLDRVMNALAPGGRLILDVRKGTDGMKLLERRFSPIRSISETQKKLRVLACNEQR